MALKVNTVYSGLRITETGELDQALSEVLKNN